MSLPTMFHALILNNTKLITKTCQSRRGVNPGGLGGRDPQGFGDGVLGELHGGLGGVVKYYFSLSCTLSMFEIGDF